MNKRSRDIIGFRTLSLLFSTLLFGIAMTIYDPVWPFVVKEANIDPSEYSYIVFTAQLLEFISRLFSSGYLMPSISFVVGSLSISFSMGVLLYSISPPAIYTSLSTLRLGRALHFLGRGQIIGRMFKKRGLAFSVFRLSSQIGMLLGPLLGYLIYSMLSRNFIFLSGFLLGIFSAVVFLPYIKEMPKTVRRGLLFWRGGVNRDVKIVTGLTFINNMARQTFIPFHFIVAPYLFNVDPGYIALAAFLERGVSMLSSVPIGWLSDRIGDKRFILIFSEAMLSIGILFYIYPYLGILGFLASTFFIGLGTASYAPIVSALVSELSPDNPEDAVGFLLTAISLSRLPGSIVIGPLMAILGYGGGFTFTLICLGIVGLGLFIHYLKSSSLPIK